MAIIGVFLSVASAFLASVTDVLRKRNSASFDSVIAAWALHGTTFLLALPVVLLVNGTGLHTLEGLKGFAHAFPTSGSFWAIFPLTLALSGMGSLLSMRALAKADLSLAAPLGTLSPIFLFITVPFVTGEFPSWIGILGILVTTLGTFLLVSRKGRSMHLWTPFTKILKDWALRDIVIVGIIFSIAAPWQKLAILEGGSLWYTVLIHGGLTILIFPLLFRNKRWSTLFRAHDWPALLPFGAVNLLRSYAEFTALGFLSTFYVIGLKRTAALFGVFWGRTIFKEPQTGRRAIAAVIMLVGALLILVAAMGA